MTTGCGLRGRASRRLLVLPATALLVALFLGLFRAQPTAGAFPGIALTQKCNASPVDDPFRPDGYHVYFADEFDCAQLLEVWQVQPPMTMASYTPPATGYVQLLSGTLRVGIPQKDISFPFLYLIDDSVTTYDIPYSTKRTDWLPDTGDFRIAMRVRFNVEALGEHRISIYADGHSPAYAGPLFYIGSDYNDEHEDWRGLIIGADRGNSFVDLGEHGYADPYSDWVVLTVDYAVSDDLLTMSVDGAPFLTKTLSTFKGAPDVATRPDVLYVGSLARLEKPSPWTDIELDWLRVYAPETTPLPKSGLVSATVEAAPMPSDGRSSYAQQLPAGPFANTPYWSEDFDDTPGRMPGYWQLLLNHDPDNAWTEVASGKASIKNNGQAAGVPVWGVADDMLPASILSIPDRHTPQGTYLAQRNTPPLTPLLASPSRARFLRFDWRPNQGNVRYAWKARQTANGYGVEVSNGGHFPYFTGAMFYILLDTTTNNGQGQFIFPSCQEQYFWPLHLLPQYRTISDKETLVTVDYINGAVFVYVDGVQIGWWLESDCSLNWFLKGENATSPDLLFFGNPAVLTPGRWSEVDVDWFATFPGLPKKTPPVVMKIAPERLHFDMTAGAETDVMSTTVQLMAPATESISWTARLSTVPSWLQFGPVTGTLGVVQASSLALPNTVAPPVTAPLVLTVTRPFTYGVYTTFLTVNGVAASGQPVAPAHAQLTLRYFEQIHRVFLPFALDQRAELKSTTRQANHQLTLPRMPQAW